MTFLRKLRDSLFGKGTPAEKKSEAGGELFVHEIEIRPGRMGAWDQLERLVKAGAPIEFNVTVWYGLRDPEPGRDYFVSPGWVLSMETGPSIQGVLWKWRREEDSKP